MLNWSSKKRHENFLQKNNISLDYHRVIHWCALTAKLFIVNTKYILLNNTINVHISFDNSLGSGVKRYVGPLDLTSCTKTGSDFTPVRVGTV